MVHTYISTMQLLMVLLYSNMIVVGHQMLSIRAVLSSYMLLLIGSLVIFTMSHLTAVCIITSNSCSIFMLFFVFFKVHRVVMIFAVSLLIYFSLNRIESEYFDRCRVSSNHESQLLAIQHLESSIVKYHNNNNSSTYHSYYND